MTNPAVSPEPVNPRGLRVSDAEREHVVNLLQKAIGLGLINLDEFTTRTDVALAARTRSELNSVLVDLPGMIHPGSAPARAPVGEPVVVGGTSVSPVVRTGQWVVPRELVVRNRWALTDLDFTNARIDHTEVRIQLDTRGGPVRLRLPAGASVTIDDLRTPMGGPVHDEVGYHGQNFPPESGRVHFVVSGRASMGPVAISTVRSRPLTTWWAPHAP